MTKRSILVKQEINAMLQGAKRAFENDGYLLPNLFIYTTNDEMYSLTLSLSETTARKSIEFMLIRHRLYAQGLKLQEAVLVMESWFVNAQQAPSASKFAPSQHPSRQEAIVAIGRSADHRRYTQVVQPFTRDKMNRPVWQPMPLAMYDEPCTAQDGPRGLLDFLFEGFAECA